MKRGTKLIAVIAVAGLAAAASAHDGHMGPPPGGMGGPPPMGGMGGPPPMGGTQQPGGQPQGGQQQGHEPQAPDANRVAHLLAMLSDADRSHDVTADEWSAFLATLNADANGVIALDDLAAVLPPPRLPPGVTPDAAKRDEMLLAAFDKDGDGSVTLDDMNAFFAVLDADSDGALSEAELAPPMGDHPHHDGPPPAGQGGHDGAPGECQGKAAGLLAHAADANDDHVVSSDELAAFLASVDTDGDGVVNMDELAAALPTPPNAPEITDTAARDAALTRAFDFDGDGVLQVSDLQSLFDGLDTNGDGTAQKRELRGPKPMRGGDRKAAMALFRAADGDQSRDVSADEWSAFLSGLTVDGTGAVSLDDLASKLPAPRRAAPDTAKRDQALTRAFDKDGDGVVTLADLQAIFDMVDANADGALDQTELRPKR